MDLTGSYEDEHYIITRGDARVSMIISKNEYTCKFDRTMRFILDFDDSPIKMAFELTKPLKVGGIVGGKGTYGFVLAECTPNDYDNLDECIADYYRYFDRDLVIDLSTSPSIIDPTKADDRGRENWL